VLILSNVHTKVAHNVSGEVPRFVTTFSIITVCLNSAATIRDAVRSVLAQDYRDIEYVVVDGASNDETIQIVGEYGDRISKFLSAPDKNVYDAMNTGIALASGEIIGFLNSDDFYPSNEVISSVASVFDRTGADAVYGDLFYVGRNDVSRVVRYWRSRRFTRGDFARGWCPPHPTFFVRRSVYERLGGFDPEFPVAGDIELMMRFLEVHQVSSVYLPMVLVKMRMGGQTNRSIRNIVVQNRRWIAALRKHGLEHSWPRFLAHKAWSRFGQFISRPAAG
jgi:glycosyltransferase involved in cell wall biosynthesis